MKQWTVQLYCYDLSAGMAASMSLLLIGRHLEAIWHTAIVAYGKEFYFSGNEGIMHDTPGRTRFGQPLRIADIGVTTRTEEEFLEWVEQQGRNGFGPNDYDLFRRNCNHFSQEAARFLAGRDIPEDIRNMVGLLLNTPLGQLVQPILERVMNASAPQLSSVPTRAGLHSNRKRLTEEEEETLMVARAMLHSNDVLSLETQEGLDAMLGALELLCTALTNILNHPCEEKYRRLSTTSESYKKKLLALEECGVSEIFRLCGFRLEGGKWQLADADGSTEVLRIVVDNLRELQDIILSEAATLRASSAIASGNEQMSRVEKSSCPSAMSSAGVSGGTLLEAFEHDAGMPLNSVDELMNWSASGKATITPAVPCRQRVSNVSKKGPQLLVCHDMCGGYLPGDYAYFALCDNSSVMGTVGKSYTVNYWSLVDYFIYFSHHFVTIPPKEWINAGHREGVPVLGTLIDEGMSSRICSVLENPIDTAAMIHKLVALCDAYNFDGYLLNVETSVSAKMAKRLVGFVAMLRKELNKDRTPSSCKRVVVWYDAVTTSGKLIYQNSLSDANKGFFDVSDFLFTNYFWKPEDLKKSLKLAGNRSREVCVGVDVHGRGVCGGGGHKSHMAAECAVKEGLSVALFAVGWAVEVKGEGRRERFLKSNAHMWSKLQISFSAKCIEYNTLPVWTCFRSGVGNQFFVNGTRVVGDKGGGTNPHTVDWCQLSQTHITPCCQFFWEKENENVWCTLPLKMKGVQRDGDTVPVEWTNERVWMGDCSLSFAVPPSATVTLMHWRVALDSGSIHDTTLAFLDIAWLREPNKSDSHGSASEQVCIEGMSGSSVTRLVFSKVDSACRKADSVTLVGDWEIVRYPIPKSTKWSHVTSVAVSNSSADQPLHCTIGGIGLAAPFKDKNTSVLLAGPKQQLQNGAFNIRQTNIKETCIIEFQMPQTVQSHENFLFFVKVGIMNGKSACVYMGQHTVKPNMSLPLHIPEGSLVQELFFYRVITGS